MTPFILGLFANIKITKCGLDTQSRRFRCLAHCLGRCDFLLHRWHHETMQKKTGANSRPSENSAYRKATTIWSDLRNARPDEIIKSRFWWYWLKCAGPITHTQPSSVLSCRLFPFTSVTRDVFFHQFFRCPIFTHVVFVLPNEIWAWWANIYNNKLAEWPKRHKSNSISTHLFLSPLSKCTKQFADSQFNHRCHFWQRPQLAVILPCAGHVSLIFAAEAFCRF